MKKYPDVSDIFALKEARRRRLARLPIAEKIAIAERLREVSRNVTKLVSPKTQGTTVSKESGQKDR